MEMIEIFNIYINSGENKNKALEIIKKRIEITQQQGKHIIIGGDFNIKNLKQKLGTSNLNYTSFNTTYKRTANKKIS
jgi:hypothetical protein